MENKRNVVAVVFYSFTIHEAALKNVECSVNVGLMRGRCWVDVGLMWGRYRVDRRSMYLRSKHGSVIVRQN